MRYLPVFLEVAGRPALVVGGGAVARRKVGLLLGAGARVRVIAPGLEADLARLAAAGRVEHVAEAFRPPHLEGAALVFAATAERTINAAVAAAARVRSVPVNVADDPALCSFVMPSIIDRSPLVVAVSTGGVSPVLARLVRARIEALLPPRLGELARLAGSFREPVKRTFERLADRRRFWERVLAGPLAEAVYAGRDEQARELIEQALAEGVDGGHELWVLLDGAGAADLQPMRAVRVLQQADVVLWEAGVNPGILELARRDAERWPLAGADPTARLEEALQAFQRLAWICAARPGRALAEALEDSASRGVRVHRIPPGPRVG